MNGTHLNGLEGTNPLGFLAALGIQVAFASKPEQPSLWWSDDITPHAIIDNDFSIERISEQALKIFAEWKDSPALNPKRIDDSTMDKGDELKFASSDIRLYLKRGCQCSSSGALASALVAEGSIDRKGEAKPSDLYFTAGQQKFLDMARQILGGVSQEEVLTGLRGPWSYKSQLPSLMWDISDDRVYALTADDPAKDKKLTNPGPEALAILGLSLYPVFAGRGRTLTQGCSGSWKNGYYSWPLWYKPARPHSVKSLLTHASVPDQQPMNTDRYHWFCSWSISKILRSEIRRSSQGGYGTFAPSDVIWQDQRNTTLKK